MSWMDGVFPQSLRGRKGWPAAIGGWVRTYFLNADQPMMLKGFHQSDNLYDAIKANLNADFAVDLLIDPPTHRHIAPYDYNAQQRASSPTRRRWSGFGRDQADYVYRGAVMRLDSIVKAIHAADRLGVTYTYSADGVTHQPNEVSIHPAIYTIEKYTSAYYDAHIASLSSVDKDTLYQGCKIRRLHHGAEVPTFREMSVGMPATHRTCEGLLNFVSARQLPPLGQIVESFKRPADLGAVAQMKQKRKSPFANKTYDCAVELPY